VSGGADSTALLLGLGLLAPAFELELCAAHLHHGLRGAEADADLEFVAGLCRDHAVPLLARRWNVPERMRRRGLSGHAGMRVLRREFLMAAARHFGAPAIATAHTADDQLETVLMRLLRGSGLRGLGGMRARHGPWIKPLIECTRRDLEADLEARGQPWREDRSNTDPRYLRSRIRGGAIPALLEALAPGAAAEPRARERLARRVTAAARELRDAHGLVAARARRLEPATRGACVSIAVPTLAAAPAAVRSAVLRRLWRRVAPAGLGLTHAQVDALRALIVNPREGACAHLAAGRIARVESGALVFASRGEPAPPSRRHGRAAVRNGKLRRCAPPSI